jgi:hypothetical protein
MEVGTGLRTDMMEALKDYFGISNDDATNLKFRIYQAGYSSLSDYMVELEVHSLSLIDEIAQKYRFNGQVDDGYLIGTVISTGVPAFFVMATQDQLDDGETPIKGSIGLHGTSADITFNETQWTEGDIVTISELTIVLADTGYNPVY